MLRILFNKFGYQIDNYEGHLSVFFGNKSYAGLLDNLCAVVVSD